MRIARLELARYGHFTDRVLEFAEGARDFHVVFGANEAGKSTVLAAIEDLLFGIPQRSPYRFLHDYREMRIGATIENAAGAFSFFRRKGGSDSLVDAAGNPVAGGEGRLGSLLAGTDRAFFGRMFSLDHGRLEAGGRDILDSKDDAGQAIFAAGAGLGNLRATLAEISEEADSLWAPRRAQHRELYQALDRCKEADRALREVTLTADSWRSLKRALDDAEQAHDGIEEEFRKTSAERRRLSRIRRVYPDLRRRDVIEAKLGEPDAPALLPEDAGELFDRAQRQLSEGTARKETLAEQLAEIRGEIDKLVWDENLIEHEPRVAHLHRQSIEIMPEVSDLPKREAELAVLEGEVRRFAAELDWTDADAEDVAGRIPPRAAVQDAHTLLQARAALQTDLDNRREALASATARQSELQQRRGEGETPADTANLAAAIAAARRKGDIVARLQKAEEDFALAEDRTRDILGTLVPAVADERQAAEIPAPSGSAIQAHGRRNDGIERERQELQRERAEAEREIGRQRADQAGLQRRGQTISAADLEKARRRRDDLWELVRLNYIDGAPGTEPAMPVDAPADPGGAMEEAMRTADRLADQRFDTAQAYARLSEIAQAITVRERELADMDEREKSLDERQQALDREWRAMWDGAPFDPLPPDAMEQWVERRDTLAAAVARAQETDRDLAVARRAVDDARAAIVGELAALDEDPRALDGVPLNLVVERADMLRERLDAEAREITGLDQGLREVGAEIDRLQAELERARDALERWEDGWAEQLARLGLPADISPDDVTARIDIIDRIRDRIEPIRELRDRRIGKIRRDIETFEAAVKAAVAELADDLAEGPCGDAIHELSRRTEEARTRSEQRRARLAEAEAVAKRIADLERDLEQARVGIGHLMRRAGTDSPDGLGNAIARSDQRRALERELRDIDDRLVGAGDGLALDELRAECAGIDPDGIAALEESCEARLKDVNNRKADTAVILSEARKELEKAGGGDAAARAGAGRQQALAEAGRIAGRYVRAGTSEILLRWAIDRYRREKQGPLLARAGELFRIMTRGSFVSLRIEYDNRDRPVLAGARADGRTVEVGGMSDGTVDQLYLALRVAALEEYLEQAGALPFVADDLFINFDDERAAAGLEVLAGLAEKTQVLFFTHHRHLVDLAREMFGPEMSVVMCAARNQMEPA